MRRNLSRGLLSVTMAALPVSYLQAQDKVEAHLGLDVVSEYIWRGQDMGNAALQPAISLGYKGLNLSAWGSVGITTHDTKELDLTLSYTVGGFTIGLTDYWFAYPDERNRYFTYKAHETAHVWEVNLGYDFGVVNVNWYTNFAGADGETESGHRAYSSYIQLAAPFRLGGLEWAAEVGATPWATSFYKDAMGFAVVNAGLKAQKTFRIRDRFDLPLWVRLGCSPASEDAHLVVGTSISY